MGVAVGLDSVAFISKTKPKEENEFFNFPLKFDSELHSRCKTERDRLTDRLTDRFIDKMTTVTLWCMCAEG